MPLNPDPPKFKPPPSSTAVGVESESLVVAMVANGNPAMIQYTWTKDGQPILPKNGKLFVVFHIFSWVLLYFITSGIKIE